MTGLTPQQATQDALAALKAAGLGREHKRPVKAVSWNLGRYGRYDTCDTIRTEVTVRKADQDDAIRALIVLPGVQTYEYGRPTRVTINRRVTWSTP